LDRKEIAKLEDPIREALKSIEKLDFHLEKTDTGITRIATKPLQRKKQKVRVIVFLFVFLFKSIFRTKMRRIIHRKRWISIV